MKFALCFLVCAFLTHQTQSASTASYSAKVMDFYPNKDNTPSEVLTNNVERIVREINSTEKKFDIIVFPEYGITGVNALTSNNVSQFAVKVPDVGEKNLCKKDNVPQIIDDLACIALEKPTVLVVNLLERVDEDVYNTNVVFDPTGIIGKYRKINLNEQEKRCLKAGTTTATFEAFGVTFGLITGDDILFKNPAQEVIKERHVTDVIMTSAWQSEVPFFTTIGLQHGYAKRNGINLLVSSYCEPGDSRGGSGIYTPKGGETVYVPKTTGSYPSTKTIAALEVKRPEAACDSMLQPRGLVGTLPSIDSYITKPMSHVGDYLYKSIQSTNFEDELCKGKLCCKFSIKTGIYTTLPIYKILVSEEACGVMACDDKEDLTKCGSRSSKLNETEFTSLKIVAKLENKELYQYMPVSSNLGLELLKYKYCESSSAITMELTENTKGVVHFGLIIPGEANSANHVFVNFGLPGVVAIFMSIFNSLY